MNAIYDAEWIQLAPQIRCQELDPAVSYYLIKGVWRFQEK